MGRLRRPLRPVGRKWPVSNPYGVKNARYAAGYHTGIDYEVPVGTRVRAPRAGVVKFAGYDKAYGFYVLLTDWKGRKGYLVAHLSRRVVRTGQWVARGQTLGRSGNTGASTAPHVHAEQRVSPYGYWNHEKPDWV